MKKSLLAVILAAFVGSVMAQPAKQPEPKVEKTEAVKNDNCVKKDKNGKCPPLPKSEKPTPKKKIEKS